jgi:hypothetical protein
MIVLVGIPVYYLWNLWNRRMHVAAD